MDPLTASKGLKRDTKGNKGRKLNSVIASFSAEWNRSRQMVVSCHGLVNQLRETFRINENIIEFSNIN